MSRQAFLLALVLALTAAAAGAQQPTPDSRRTLGVTGHGEIAVAPEEATVRLAVETEAPDAASAAQRNAEATARVVAALETAVGESGRVTTTGYGLSPRYSGMRPGRESEAPEIAGYTARNQVQVETTSLGDVGALVDAAVAAGANRVDDISFGLAARSPHLAAALAEAAADARRQAESLASALGVALGDVVVVRSGQGPVPMPYQQRMMAMESAMVDTPVQPGDVTVQASVEVVWELR